MRRSLCVLAAGALAGAALLVPGTASAETDPYWSRPYQESHARSRVADPGNDITWTVLDHKVVVTTPDLLVVPFVFTCGTADDPKNVEYSPAAFQTVYTDSTAGAYVLGDGTLGYPTFACDGTQHIMNVPLVKLSGVGFENGNIEVGLVKAENGPDTDVAPTFEHAVIGYDQLHDTRVPVAVTVNATPESTRPGSKITVKGTVKRGGKAYEDKAATLYFQTRTGEPATEVGGATADSKGRLSTKVTVTGPGTYFWTTTSTSKTQGGASPGDYAAAA